MLTIEEAFEVIGRERAYQEKTWPEDDVNDSGISRKQRQQGSEFFLTLLQIYIGKAHTAWNGVDGQFAAMQQIAKIAAIAIAALEKCGASDRLYSEGLR